MQAFLAGALTYAGLTSGYVFKSLEYVLPINTLSTLKLVYSLFVLVYQIACLKIKQHMAPVEKLEEVVKSETGTRKSSRLRIISEIPEEKKDTES